MRKSVKIITALSVAGLAVTAGSAFTATSTIDAGQKFIGGTTQDVSGVAVTAVQYTTDATTDVTSAVSFHVSQELGTESTLTAKITGTTTGATPTAGTSSSTCSKDTAVVGTDLTCTFTTTLSNVTKLEIVAS